MGALQFSTTSISVPRIMLNGGDSTNVYHGFGVGASSMRISVPSSGSHYIAFGSNSAGNFAEQMRLQNNGNVGINTTNPNYTLDVAGNVNFTGNLTQNGSAFGGASQWTTFGNNIAYTKGNVGIGTGSSTANGTLSVITGSAQQAVAGWNNTWVTIGPGTSAVGSGSGNVGIGYATSVDSGQVAYVGGNLICLAPNSAWIDMNYKANSHKFMCGSFTSPNLMITSSGFVGINNTNPSYALDTLGNGRVAVNGTTSSFYIGNGTYSVALNLWDGAGAAWQIATGSYNLSIGNGTIGGAITNRVTFASSGNVGIGTSSPQSPLHVVGSVIASGFGSPGGNYVSFGNGAGTANFSLQGNNGIFGGSSFTFNAPVTVNGSLAKTSGTFDIQHPTVEGKRLIHSFVEGPRCDLIYRGHVSLVNGTATVDLDKECVEEPDCAMTDGTFVALCRNPQYFLQNNTSFSKVRGSITDNILTIISEDVSSNDNIYWMVVAERGDPAIMEWDKTNSHGYLKTEY
jgi:hypothetical protein